MVKPAAVGQPLLVNDASGATFPLSATHVRYLSTVRQLLVKHQHTRGSQQREMFVEMMHAFMQELCAYPPSRYIMTRTAYGNTDTDHDPQVVAPSDAGKFGIFYFTASESPDDVQDLWVRQAQVYLTDPRKGDVTAESASHVVFSNFFVIDGASKDPTSGAWHLWSASDIEGAQVARVDIRTLENATELTSMMAHGVQQRLQTIQYRVRPGI